MTAVGQIPPIADASANGEIAPKAGHLCFGVENFGAD
jgi:hypothetical protein